MKVKDTLGACVCRYICCRLLLCGSTEGGCGRGKWRDGGGDVKVKDTLGACVDTLLQITIV